MPEVPKSEKVPFDELVPLNIPMPREEAIGYLLENFSNSSEEAILDAFINLKNAEEDCLIIFKDTINHSTKLIVMQEADNKWTHLLDPDTGQPVMRS